MASLMSNSSFGKIPSGTTANRPASPAVGDQYYNGTIGALEVYTSSGWKTTTSSSGNTSARPASPYLGQSYFNGETARLELYTATGWQNIVQEVPGVASISGNYSQQTDSGTIIIQGTNFVSGAVASAIGTNGVEIVASSTTYNSLVQLTSVFTGLSNDNEPYDIKVTNPSNLFGLIPDALYVNASPVWTTASGSLGTFNEQVSVSISATATDSDSTITYSLANGSSLPSGVTLNSSTGLISGTLPDISTDTTYSFTINASDAVNTIPRTFSISSKYLIPVEYLVVGGGGGGAGTYAGGGGAGGYRTSSILLERTLSYAVSVGLGGTASQGSVNGGDGGNSIFGSITSIGGGGGGKWNDGSGAHNGRTGGSGGGGGGVDGGSPYGFGGAGTSGQGNAGGNSTNNTSISTSGGGGGGGASAVGGAASGSNAGSGGDGLGSSITGTLTYYAGGGGGGVIQAGNTAGNGGLGGGGAGGKGSGNAVAGTPNTGGGGGGSGGIGQGFSGSGNPGIGGSGVVIIAYPNTYPAITTIPGTLTYDQPTRSGYRVYRFTAGSGTVTV
jgi:hypothetical protein